MAEKVYVERDANGDVVALRKWPVEGVVLELLPENHADIKAYHDRVAEATKRVDFMGLMLTGWAIGRGLVNPDTDAKVINQYNNDMQALWDKRQKG